MGIRSPLEMAKELIILQKKKRKATTHNKVKRVKRDKSKLKCYNYSKSVLLINVLSQIR